jgi:DNA-directed RNA polymerase specialized sigma24 family protein
MRKIAPDLHWLVFLLTGNREQHVDIAADTIAVSDIANPFFERWMAAWSRRVAIAKTLTTIRKQLAASARRTELTRPKKPVLSRRDQELSLDATESELESALLAIDDFPRAALVLSAFEGIPVADSAILLDTSPGLVTKAQAVGLQELASSLARVRGWTHTTANLRPIPNEVQYA